MKSKLFKLLPILVFLISGLLVYFYHLKQSDQKDRATKKYAQEVYRSHQWEFPTVLAPDTPPNLVYMLLKQINSVEGGKKTAYILRSFDNGKWFLYSQDKSEFDSNLALQITNSSDAKLAKATINNHKTTVVSIPISLKDRTRVTDFFLLTGD